MSSTSSERRPDLDRDAMSVLPSGLSTGIGHLPHCDPGDAVEFVLRHGSRLPSAPSLPARSRREGMVAQGAAGIRGISIDDHGELTIDSVALDPHAPLDDLDFHSDAWLGLRAFLTAIADRDGPVKVSITGPVTLGVALEGAGISTDLAFRIAQESVRRRAAALVDHVLGRAPQVQLVVFLDEPAMGRLTDREFPIGPNEGVDLVSSALASIETRAVTGLHCCTAVDHRLLLAAGARVLSVPVDESMVRSAGAIADHLDRDGWIAWGAVPVGGPVGQTPERLVRRLHRVWLDLAEEGCDPVRLRSNAIITPVCGLAWHGVTQAEQVMEFTHEIADRLLEDRVAVRSASSR